MFFDLDLLCRKKQGKFALIWHAATRGVHLIQRKEINNIDIVHTCDELLVYIMSHSQSPRKRFSLYLSSKLIYGTALIYRQQVRNFQSQIFHFISIIRRPPIDLNPALLDDNDLCDVPKKKRKPRTKATKPPLEEQLVLQQNIDLQAELANLNITDAINITLREEVPNTRVVEQELFGDEGQLDLQLLMLNADSWDTIVQSTTIPPMPEADTAQASPSKRRRTDEMSPHTPFAELTQKEQDRLIEEIGMQVSPVLGRDSRFAQLPVDHINIPSEKVQVPQILDKVQPHASILQPRQADVAPTNGNLAPIRRRKRVRLPRFLEPMDVDTPRKWGRGIKANDVDQLMMIVNQDSRRSQSTSNEDARDILATILASVQHTEEDLISIARDIREKSNLSIESGPRDIAIVADHQKQTLPSVVEQIEANIEDTEIIQVDENIIQSTIINEPLPISPRHTNLLTLIRGLFKEYSSLTIDQLCFPPTRFNVARTFQGLLHLEAKQYIYMETHPDSIELSAIKPGARI